MRHTFKLLAATVAAATICSCSTLTGYPTDAEASYAKAIEIAKKSVDTDKFKVYSLSFMEGETLSDNLFLISVKLVNRDNQAFSQSYYMTGLEPTALRDVQRTFEDPEYETTVGIDLTKLDAAQIAAQIAQAPRRAHLQVGRPLPDRGGCPGRQFGIQPQQDIRAAAYVVRRPLHRGRQGDRKQRGQNVVYLLRGRGDRGTRRHAFDRRKLSFSPGSAVFSRFFLNLHDRCPDNRALP